MEKQNNFIKDHYVTLIPILIAIIIALVLNIIYLHSEKAIVNDSIRQFKGTYEINGRMGDYFAISPAERFVIQNGENNIKGIIKPIEYSFSKEIVYYFTIEDKANYLMFVNNELIWINEAKNEIAYLKRISDAYTEHVK